MLLVTIFNSVLALILLILGSPLLIFLAILLRITGGPPVFYKGIRLGINKKTFVIYKFRTLPVNAQQIIGAELLSDNHRMVSPLTRFLRATRLDEIPQLINILNGDMDFIGPRPERPEVYETRCKNIKDYDRRFMVKPGLIGYSQLFTPHGTPKIVRTHIDNRLMLKKRQFSWSIYLIVYTILIVLKDVYKEGVISFRTFINTRIRKKYAEHRTSRRLRPQNITVYWRLASDQSQPYQTDVILFDINDYCFRLHSKEKLPRGALEFKLSRRITRDNRHKTKRVLCKGEVVIERTKEDDSMPHISIIQYSPVSQLNQYLMDKYFTEQSMA